MYILRITPLLRTFHAFGQSGNLYIEPAQEHTEDAWKAYLRLQQGSVSSCYVQRQSDQQILWQDTKAIQWLETKEKLFWTLEDNAHPASTSPVPDTSSHNRAQMSTSSRSGPVAQQTLSATHKKGSEEKMNMQYAPTPIPAALALIPQRALLAEETLATFSRDHKRVFALIDGKRTATQIAALLHYPPEHVIQLLQKLQKKGLVTL